MNIEELNADKEIQDLYTSMQEAKTGREALASAAKKHGFGTKEREAELVKRGEEIAARNKRLDAEEAARYGKKNEEVELDEAMDVHNKKSFKSQEMKHELGHEDEPKVYNGYGKVSQTPKLKGMFFYNVPEGKEQSAAACNVKKTKSGKWALTIYDTSGASSETQRKRADIMLGKGKWWEPKKVDEEVELDESERSEKKAKIISSLDRIMAAAKANTDKQKVKKVVDERYDTDLDADKDGKLSAKDFKLLRDKKKKEEELDESDKSDKKNAIADTLSRMIQEAEDNSDWRMKRVHKDYLSHKNADSKTLLKRHMSMNRVDSKYSLADVGGKQGAIAGLLHHAHGSKDVDKYFALKPKERAALSEAVELEEARSKPEMKVYHPSYSAAISHAEEHLNKQGYQIHPDDMWDNVNTGPKKPSEGKTNQLHIPLHKDGVPTNKMAHIQVYNRGNAIPNNMELNMYTSSTGRQKKLREGTSPAHDAEVIAQNDNGSSSYHVGSIDNKGQVPSNATTSFHPSHSEIVKKLVQHLTGATLPSDIPCPEKGEVKQFSLNSNSADKNSINAQIENSETQVNPFKLSIWK